MSKEKRLLFSALTVAVYAMAMFAAAGFFYESYRDLISKCGRFSYADCYSNDALIVSSVSLRIGTAVFFLMGSLAWMLASYLGLHWARLRGSVTLP